ncbi:hypothetical protein M1L60_35725 [Actinoplanes sp. TRM 88003]|uniref:EamA domain-containing protein n=1 Tax=Paractinoplanes aksuensis TaxID=2939490 RepID=A0ABT1DYI0_9ACTN|nr:hypothetical protein [Actinoplanes aksuensis]MCO8275941.1 hypothetical protein [Actinoplanes aksuensis]
MGLPPLALGLVLSSALLHALWNVLLAGAPKGFEVTIAANTFGFIAWTPLALTRWRVDDAAWGYLAVSACFSVTYFLLLNVAYARAPVHAAYPVARGLAPVLVLLLTLPSTGLPAWSGLGVLVISGGILLTASGANRRSVLAAAPVAVSLTCYTYVASLGLRHADPAPYFWLTMAPLVVVTALARPRAVRDNLRPVTLVIGLGSFAAHGLALAAIALVAAAEVPAIAALRETGILFVIAMAALSDHKPTARTAVGAALIFAGVAVLALGCIWRITWERGEVQVVAGVGRRAVQYRCCIGPFCGRRQARAGPRRSPA